MAIALTNWLVIDGATRTWPSDLARTSIAEVAVVPGCHVDGLRPAPMLRARLVAALELYRTGRVKRILVTGNEAAGEATAMEHWLREHGVPADDILVDGSGVRTLESIKHASMAFGIKSAAICTQAIHLPRALFLAREAGIDAVGVKAEFDPDRSIKWQAVEAFKRTLAFAEVKILGHLERVPVPVPGFGDRGPLARR